MTKVFVHGNPETAAVWDDLAAELARRGVDDVVRLSPPGFGAPVPDRWGATKEEYADWLVARLRSIGGEIDLVGHDWGAGHVLGALATDPGLVRTWATDCAGLVHRDYVWHDAAQAWQTPGVGEEAVAGMAGLPEADKAALFEGLGVPADIAGSFARALDAEMGRCILALYRSAAQPLLANVGTRLAAARHRPGLALIPTADPYTGGPERAEEMAALAGARALRLEGAVHWWMFDDLDARARLLTEFWAQA